MGGAPAEANVVLLAAVLMLAPVALSAAGGETAASSASANGELLWYTPHDTAWTLWTDQDGDPPATEPGTFGPQVTLPLADQGTTVASPSLSGADRVDLWFESHQDSSHLTRWAHLTDASGTRLLSLGQGGGSFHLFVPGEDEPRALPWIGRGHLSGPERVELTLEEDAIVVGFRGNTDRVTVPAGTTLGHLELQAPTDDDGTVHGAISFLEARATRGPVLDETFNGPTVDPRLHPSQTYEASGGQEHQDSFTGARDRGQWAIQGSPLPEGRVFLSASTEGLGESYVAEAVVRPNGAHWMDQADGIAALAGPQDPGIDQPAWALVLSPADRSLDGSSLALDLVLPDGTSAALTTFHVNTKQVHTAHLLRVAVDAAAGTLAIQVDGERQGSFVVGNLAAVEAVVVGDLEPGAAPLVGGTGAGLVPADGPDGPDLLVESVFLAGLPEVAATG